MKINPEIEKIIDMAYGEWLNNSDRAGRKRKHPSRTEFGLLFMHIFPYTGTILKIVEARDGGEIAGNQ